jgi:uncharacterized membrane protein YidH (DUF202 family)
MTTREPEPGVYNERTALAWQRTALALLAGSAVVARLALEELGVVAVAGFLVVLPLVAWVLLESRGRYRHHAGIRLRARSRGGRAPAVLAVVTVLVALTELAALLSA